MISENQREVFMGGYGSGRSSGRPTTGGFRRLDVRRLSREGFFTGGPRCGTWTWSREGEVVASIGYQANREAVTLDYKANGEPQRYTVSLEWTPCHYGGARPWFRCPGRGCGRRCAVLYGGRIFACRRCHGLAYESQREDRSGRLLSKAHKIRARLGAEPGTDPEKPPRMHWRTFNRLADAADAAESASLMCIGGALGRMLRADLG